MSWSRTVFSNRSQAVRLPKAVAETRSSPAETHLGFDNSDFFPVQLKLEAAFYPVSDTTGLGIEVNEEFLARQSFEFWEAPRPTPEA